MRERPRFVFLVVLAAGAGCTVQASGPASQSDKGSLQPFGSSTTAPSSEGAASSPASQSSPATAEASGAASGEEQPRTGEMLQPSLPLGAIPPPPAAVPGVVVVENELGRGAPLCVTTTTAGSNADGSLNEWGYENATACVIPGTITARGNQAKR